MYHEPLAQDRPGHAVRDPQEVAPANSVRALFIDVVEAERPGHPGASTGIKTITGPPGRPPPPFEQRSAAGAKHPPAPRNGNDCTLKTPEKETCQ